VSSETTSNKSGQSPRPPRRTLFARRPRPQAPDREGWMLLASSGWHVRLSDVLDQPTTGVLVTEDACWQFAMRDWESRRPRPWRPSARREWRAEGTRLEDKRLRLVEMTRQVRTLRPKSAPGPRSDQSERG
jgi:hypothetical protein